VDEHNTIDVLEANYLFSLNLQSICQLSKVWFCFLFL